MNLTKSFRFKDAKGGKEWKLRDTILVLSLVLAYNIDPKVWIQRERYLMLAYMDS